MPAAYNGTGVGINAQLVIVLFAIDGVNEADERIVGAGIRLGRHGDIVFDAAIIYIQPKPFVTSIQHEAVSIGRQQIGIATLVGIAVDVDSRASQVAVGGALDVLTVGE